MPIRKTIVRDSAKLSSELAALRASSTSTRTSDAITATGEINTARYGHVLRARRLVSVAGVGDGYNGDYYVQSITHQIRRGEYKQRFTLKRSGHGATGPRGVA